MPVLLRAKQLACFILHLRRYLLYLSDVVLKGLLTVDPKERLTMQDLLRNEWINGTNLEVLSTTPLATPDVLSLTRGSVSTVHSQVTATLSAFHKAHRAGFRLQDVSNAPLVRRRKRMREEGGSSGSTDSSRASTPIPPSVNVPSPLALGVTTSPTLGVTSGSPSTSGFQPFGSMTQPASCSIEPLPPLSVLLPPQSGSALRDLLQRDDSTASCGFNLHNSPALHLPGSHHSSAAESSTSCRSTPNHSPASRQTDGSSSSRGSTPQRSPLSRVASITSLGFSPAASAANSSENSCHDSEAASASQFPSLSSVVPLSLASSVSHSDSSVTVSCDNLGRKRRLPDSFDHPAHTRNDDGSDDECIIVGVSEGIASSSDSCKKPLAQL